MFSLDIGFYILVLFFQHLQTIVPLLSGLHDFCWEILCHSNYLSPVGKVLFSLLLSRLFLLSCIFGHLIMMCLSVDFIVFILLGIHLLGYSWTCSFMYLGKYGRFHTLFFWGIFSPFFSTLLLGLHWHKYHIFCYNPKGPWDTHFFFSVYFLSAK